MFITFTSTSIVLIRDQSLISELYNSVLVMKYKKLIKLLLKTKYKIMLYIILRGLYFYLVLQPMLIPTSNFTQYIPKASVTLGSFCRSDIEFIASESSKVKSANQDLYVTNLAFLRMSLWHAQWWWFDYIITTIEL